MKTKIKVLFSILLASTFLVSCINTDSLTSSDGLSSESKSQGYRFADSWGYMYAMNARMININSAKNNNDTLTEYDQGSIISTAFFLPSAGSSKFSTIGAGTVTLNSQTVPSLTPGSYMGGSTYSDISTWSVTGSSLVPAFTENLNGFVEITGISIPGWSKVSKEKDLTISLVGNTSTADNIYLELNIKGYTYGSDRYYAKSISPGSNSCTFTSSELKKVANYSPSEIGITVRVIADKYKKVEKNGRAYYIVNETYFTHAINWAK